MHAAAAASFARATALRSEASVVAARQRRSATQAAALAYLQRGDPRGMTRLCSLLTPRADSGELPLTAHELATSGILLALHAQLGGLRAAHVATRPRVGAAATVAASADADAAAPPTAAAPPRLRKKKRRKAEAATKEPVAATAGGAPALVARAAAARSRVGWRAAVWDVLGALRGAAGSGAAAQPQSRPPLRALVALLKRCAETSATLPVSGLAKSNSALGAEPDNTSSGWSIGTNPTSLVAQMLRTSLPTQAFNDLCHATVDQSIKRAAQRQVLQLHLAKGRSAHAAANRPLRTHITPLTRGMLWTPTPYRYIFTCESFSRFDSLTPLQYLTRSPGWQLESTIIRLVLQGQLRADAPLSDPVAKWSAWRAALGGKIVALRPFATEEHAVAGTKQALRRAEQWRVGRIVDDGAPQHSSRGAPAPVAAAHSAHRIDPTVRIEMIDGVLVGAWESGAAASPPFCSPGAAVLLANYDVRVLPSSFQSVIDCAANATMAAALEGKALAVGVAAGSAAGAAGAAARPPPLVRSDTAPSARAGGAEGRGAGATDDASAGAADAPAEEEREAELAKCDAVWEWRSQRGWNRYDSAASGVMESALAASERSALVVIEQVGVFRIIFTRGGSGRERFKSVDFSNSVEKSVRRHAPLNVGDAVAVLLKRDLTAYPPVFERLIAEGFGELERFGARLQAGTISAIFASGECLVTLDDAEEGAAGGVATVDGEGTDVPAAAATIVRVSCAHCVARGAAEASGLPFYSNTGECRLFVCLFFLFV